MKYIFLLLIAAISFCSSFAQVAINATGAAADASSMLDVTATNKGFLMPRITAAQRTAIASPATGLIVYQTDATTGFYYNSGTPAAPVWVRLFTGGGTGWDILGNAGTSPATNFLGTTDAQDLVIRTNNTEKMRVLSGGNVGIGTNAPSQILHVVGNEFVTGDIYINNPSYGSLHYGTGGRLGSTPTFVPNSGSGGLWIEANEGSESGGLFMNGNVMCFWSPGDADMFRFYDEDNFTTPVMMVSGGGYLGVGTTAPGERIHSSTNIRADGIVMWGNSLTRTETRDDAGLQGSAGARSGFFETSAPSPAANWPTGASSWWHMIDCRHSNPANNYALQIGGSFFDQELYFRKTNGSATTAWKRIVTWDQLIQNTYGTNNQGVTGTTDCSVNTTTYTDIPQMSITFTPVHATIYVSFTISGYEQVSGMPQQYVDFRIVKDGTPVRGSNCTAGDYDDTRGVVTSFNGSLYLAIAVTPGVPTTIKAQWARGGLVVNTIYCNAATSPDFCHRSLIIID